jgi:general secretion pathway protein H
MAVALIAVLSGTLLFGSGMLGYNRLRASAGLVISGVRLAMTRANATGRPVRLVFDLDEDTIALEETSARMLRVKDTGDKGSEGTSAGAEAVTEAEKEAVEYADGIVKGPKAPRASFAPIKSFGFDGEPNRSLDRGVRYRAVQTEHDDKPRVDGRAYLYFWPGGDTERAVVQLNRDGDDEGLTVVVSPLTGRARIERGAVDMEAPREDVDFDVREEE